MAKQSVFAGQEFNTNACGKVTVLAYNGYADITVQFQDTGYVVSVHTSNLKKGSIKDPLQPSVHGVGFLGVGPHSVMVEMNGKNVKSPAYELWANMLRRGYDEKFKESKPAYKDCSVDTRWHDFQNFCEDLSTLDNFNQWIEYMVGTQPVPYELDKDSVIKGNKVYSASACTFLTREENSTLGRNNRWK